MSPLTYSITPDITGMLYDIAAHLTLLVFFLMLCYEGHRRQYPMAAWLLSIAIILTLTLFGSRIAVFDITSWKLWWQNGYFPVATERTTLGVALFLIPAIWLIKKGLRFKAPLLDTLAFAIPVIAIIRRVGCLTAACCYGTPTESGWGIRYLGPSTIRDQHWAESIMGADRLGSAAVHPVPVYFILAAVLSLLLLQKYRKHFKQAGNLTLFVITLLFTFRFFIEFFRDPMTNHQLGAFVFGLKQVQWALLPAIVLLGFTVWFRERKAYTIQKLNTNYTNPPGNNSFTFPTLPRIAFANVLLLAFVYWMQDGFLLSEKIEIHTCLLLSGIALLAQIIKEGKAAKRHHWQTSLVVLLALVMMSQSYPADMNKIKDGTNVHTLYSNWSRANLGTPTYECQQIESGCGGTNCVLADTLHPNGARYNQFNLGYSVRNFQSHSKRRWLMGSDSTYNTFTTFGIDYQPEFFYDKKTGHRVYRGNLMPYFSWGGELMELTLGIRIGSIWGRTIANDIGSEKKTTLATSFRLGSPDDLYFIGSVENSSVLGASVHSVDLSMTMILRDYTRNRLEYLRFGVSNIYENAGLVYLEPAFNLKEKLIFTPRLGLSFRREKDFENRPAFYHPMVGLGVQYRVK